MAKRRILFFGEDEYARRLGAVRSLLSERGIDLLVTCSPGNICYLTGYFSANLFDLMAVAVPVDGAPVFYTWQFEKAQYEATAAGAEPVVWQTGDDPVKFIVDDLDRRGMKRGRISLDTGTTYTPFAVMERLMAALGATPSVRLVENVRLVKSPAEHRLIRQAAPMTDAGVAGALDRVRVGATDHEISAGAYDGLLRTGSDLFCGDPIICAGWRAGTPHSGRGGARMASGDPCFIELAGVKGRYTTPLMRTGVAGKAGGAIVELAKYSNACLDALVGAIRPGAKGSDVAAVGHKALAPILPKISFHHTYGYPVGIGFPPSWIENPDFLLTAQNHGEIKAGMVFHLPLMLRVYGRYGAGFSETVIVTERGSEVMSKLPRELIVGRTAARARRTAAAAGRAWHRAIPASSSSRA